MLRNNGIFVGLFGQQREHFADADAIDVCGNGLGERAGVGIAGVGLGVKGVQMARAAPHPDLNDGFGGSTRRRGLGEQAGRFDEGWCDGGAEHPLEHVAAVQGLDV
jgi:hypothetical protein